MAQNQWYDQRHRLRVKIEEGWETLWGEKLDDGMYRITNIPFMAYNISYGDIVSVKENKNRLIINQVLHKSGHGTIRVIFEKESIESTKSKEFIHQLQKLDCSYEGMPPMLITIDVPPSINLEDVEKLCKEYGDDWEYGDPQDDD